MRPPFFLHTSVARVLKTVSFLPQLFQRENKDPLVVSLSNHEQVCPMIRDPFGLSTGSGRTDGFV